jgi:hypothetical protein
MPPESQPLRFDFGGDVYEDVALKPGILMVSLAQVSVRYIKSHLEISFRKSLFLVLSPRTLLERPLMFHMLTEIFVCIILQIG